MSLGWPANRRDLNIAAAMGVGGLTVVTEFLLEHKWLSPAALVVPVVLAPIMGSNWSRERSVRRGSLRSASCRSLS